MIAVCTIIEQSLSREEKGVLEAMLKRQYGALSPRRLTVVWLEVPQEQAYTAARPSSMTWIVLPVPDGMDQRRREARLREISARWTSIAGIDPAQLMIAMPDGHAFSEYLRTQRARVRASARPWVAARLLIRLVVGRVRRRDLTLSVNQ